MATDGTQIKTDIDNNLANKGYRGIRVFNIITALKNLVDWVTGVVNGNLSTWLKVGTNQPGGANGDDVYHQGKLIVARTNDDGSGAVVQVNGNVKALLVEAIQFNVSGRFTSSIGTYPAMYTGNTDGAVPATISEVGSSQVALGSNMTSGYRDASYVNTNLQGNGFAWFQMLTSDTFRLLMFITADGKLGMGTKVPQEQLHVTGSAQIDGYVRTGGGNKAFKITGVKAGSGLSLKTSRYLELLLEDGTIVKVAEVN